MPIIEFDNVRYSYGNDEPALDGVSLSIEEGEFVCVLGGNGSGKSTLAKHINALLVPDSGRVLVSGLETGDPANTFGIRSTAGMVFQNPDDQIVASIVEDDVAFGPENLGIAPPLIRERVTSALGRVGLAGFEKRDVDTLSGGQKQRVAIAGALSMEPRVLILDEASSMLDPAGRRDLMGICRDLNAAGITIVMITHFMEEAACAERVIVLDNGTVALDGTPAEVLTDDATLRRLALDVPFATAASRAFQRRGIDVATHIRIDELVEDLQSLRSPSCTDDALAERPQDPPLQANRVDQGGAPLISFDGVSFAYSSPARSSSRKAHRPSAKPDDVMPGEYALRNVTFDLHEGEILGIAGRTGSGKSTLVQLCNGLLRPTEGRVLVRGLDLSDKKRAVDARREIGLVFQYPEHQLFAPTVFDDVAFGPRNLGCDEEDVEERVGEALESVHLDSRTIRYRSPFSLSGGHQRRVAFAGVLAMRPNALLLDEPVAGLDPRERESFLSLIDELRRDHGLTIILVSHAMNDLARLCDRVAVFDNGELASIDVPARVFADEELLARCGLDTSDALHLAHALGLHFDHIPSIDEIADDTVPQR